VSVAEEFVLQLRNAPKFDTASAEDGTFASGGRANSCFWRNPAQRSGVRRRPLPRYRRTSLNGRNGRKAERPVLRELAIRHGVVWPKAAGPLLGVAAGKADSLLTTQPGRRGRHKRFP
jgi:hypothetical protein